jgi:hypothetical protein
LQVPVAVVQAEATSVAELPVVLVQMLRVVKVVKVVRVAQQEEQVAIIILEIPLFQEVLGTGLLVETEEMESSVALTVPVVVEVLDLVEALVAYQAIITVVPEAEVRLTSRVH